MRWIALCLVLLFATSCGGGDDDRPPSVDWGKVTQAQRGTIDRVIDEGDCDGMQAAFDASEVADVLDYLDWHMADAGCY